MWAAKIIGPYLLMINIYVLIFILGLIVGSFLNVVILRLRKNESIIKKRSHCLFCKRKLTWQELIPVFSFLRQKGRCLGCGKKISWQYPLVEFFTGLLFLLEFMYSAPGGLIAGWQFPYIVYNLFLWTITCFLIVIFVYDLKYYLVADQIIYPAIIISFLFDIYLWMSSGQSSILISSLIASLISGGFFLIIIIISKGKWMGMGDVKIGILMGLVLNVQQIFVALFLAFMIGAIVSMVLLILKKKKLKSKIPFGPFLVLATFVSCSFCGGTGINVSW